MKQHPRHGLLPQKTEVCTNRYTLRSGKFAGSGQVVAAVGVWRRHNGGQRGLHQGLSAAQRPHQGERSAGAAAGVAGQGRLGAPLQVCISPAHLRKPERLQPKSIPSEKRGQVTRDFWSCCFSCSMWNLFRAETHARQLLQMHAQSHGKCRVQLCPSARKNPAAQCMTELTPACAGSWESLLQTGPFQG